MAAKNKQNLLSPENYIRQRSRNLPLGKCWITENWRKVGVAQILITREHINGNKTYCVYMVDLNCLGVKDTIWQFNRDASDFDEFLNNLFSELTFEEVPYPLVHNIIFAAVEYAEDLGFKPHKDFTNITEFFLEEDDDRIELIDIECGKEGKPFYVRAAYETEAQAKAIIDQLTKVKGPGGFHYILPFGEEEDDDSFDDSYEEDAEKHEEFIQDQIDTFFRLAEKDFLKLSNKELEELVNAMDDLYYEIVPESTYDPFLIAWSPEFDIKKSSEYFTHEMLGLDSSIVITDEDKELLRLIVFEKENIRENLETLEDKWGHFAFGEFLRLQFLTEQDSDEYNTKLAIALEKYPDNAILQIEKIAQILLNDPAHCPKFTFEDFFSDRTEITSYEMFRFQMIKLNYFVMENDLEAIECMYRTLANVMDPEDDFYPAFDSTLLLARISILMNFWKTSSEEEEDE